MAGAPIRCGRNRQPAASRQRLVAQIALIFGDFFDSSLPGDHFSLNRSWCEVFVI
jgi:hypothetical protein